jgi:hypothetical protein
MLGVLLVTTLPIIILLPGALFQSGPLAFSVFFSFCGEISLLDNKNMCVKRDQRIFFLETFAQSPHIARENVFKSPYLDISS